MKDLQTLSVGNVNTTTDADLEEIGLFTSLNHLSISGILTDKTILRVASLKKLETFNTGLGMVRITPSGFATLATLPKLEELTTQCNIDDKGFQQLAKLGALKKLTVTSNKARVGDAALTAFRQARPEVKVERSGDDKSLAN